MARRGLLLLLLAALIAGCWAKRRYKEASPQPDEGPFQVHPFPGWPDEDQPDSLSETEVLGWYARQRSKHADILAALTVEYDDQQAGTFDHREHAGCRGEAWCLKAAAAVETYGLAHVVPLKDKPYALTGSEGRWREIKKAGQKAERLVTTRLNQIAKEDVCYRTPKQRDLHHGGWQLSDTSMRHYHRLDSLLGIEGVLRELQFSHPVFSIADQVLDGARLLDVGIVNGLPGANFQRWHQDSGEFMLKHRIRGNSDFPFAVNVFIPLVDMREELGAPEFSVADHLSSCELSKELLKKRHLDDAQFTVGQAGSSAVAVITHWWTCMWRKQDKVRPPIAPEFVERLTRRLTLRPDMSQPGSFLIYDYLAFHRATPNYSQNASRPVLYILLGRQDYVDDRNFLQGVPGMGLFDDKAEAFMRELWQVGDGPPAEEGDDGEELEL